MVPLQKSRLEILSFTQHSVCISTRAVTPVTAIRLSVKNAEHSTESQVRFRQVLLLVLSSKV